MQNRFEQISDEVLMAYADDALSSDERRRVQAALKADANLVKRLEPFILTRSALPEIFSEALTSPMPDRLVKTVMTAPMSVPAVRTSAAVSGSFLARLRAFLVPEVPSFGSAVALAAIVAVIAGAGWLAGQAISPSAGPGSAGNAVAVNDNTPLAEGTLAKALETAPINSTVTAGGVTAVAVNTFFDKSGRVCREYSVSEIGKDDSVGFACRRNDARWQIGFHGAATAQADMSLDVNTPAGNVTSQSLDDAIEAAKAGDVLGAVEDEALRMNGWRR